MKIEELQPPLQPGDLFLVDCVFDQEGDVWATKSMVKLNGCWLEVDETEDSEYSIHCYKAHWSSKNGPERRRRDYPKPDYWHWHPQHIKQVIRINEPPKPPAPRANTLPIF